MSALQKDCMSAVSYIHMDNLTQVKDLAAKNHLPMRFFDHQEHGPVHQRIHLITVQVGSLAAVGQSSFLEEAKARAASLILEPLKEMYHYKPSFRLSFREGLEPSDCLSEVVQAYSLFTMSVSVSGTTAIGTGPTDSAAKNNAAAEMLKLLGCHHKDIFEESSDEDIQVEEKVPEPNLTIMDNQTSSAASDNENSEKETCDEITGPEEVKEDHDFPSLQADQQKDLISSAVLMETLDPDHPTLDVFTAHKQTETKHQKEEHEFSLSENEEAKDCDHVGESSEALVEDSQTVSSTEDLNNINNATEPGHSVLCGRILSQR
ncbi:hypothetical protein WMY93_000977 [Mugilogobius chulae]|uniref:DRBM domain-containing protein n=1 Tax=Mugilogobius chulae TaxID=88201 RepID=A0AAW0Q0U2_9GOBI